MKKNHKPIIILAGMAAILVLLLAACPTATNGSSLAAFVVSANGAPGKIETTELTLTFDREVPGLNASDIYFTGISGDADKLELAGAGYTVFKLGISVLQAGEIMVFVDKDGVTTDAQTVTICEVDPVLPPITYTVTVDGASNSATSTLLSFTFSDDVPVLDAANVYITNGTGAASTGILSGTGSARELTLKGVAQGNITVSINKAGIDSSGKTLAVFRDAPITYDVTADGTADEELTDMLIFTFSEEPPNNLAAGDITVTNVTGSAVKGALTGTGNVRYLALTSVFPGDETVRINRNGIETGSKPVTLVGPHIQYTVAADGAANTATTTKLVFTFVSNPPASFVAGDITIANDSGAVTRGAMTGTDTVREIAVSGVFQGNINVSIARNPIMEDTVSVPVYRNNSKPIAYTVTSNGSATATSTALTLSFAEPIPADFLTAGDITVTGNTGSVTMGALSGSGTTWTLAISDVSQGLVNVSVARTGIDATGKSVQVYHKPITYTIDPVPASPQPTTSLHFVFSENIGASGTDISAADITITNGTGAVTKGTLTGSVNTNIRDLSVTVGNSGTVNVSISFNNVETTVKTITVYQ
ncbi:MAG: hypothetical protein FWF29_04420 [Treponema sp.]|nr:hypothetical protein [Treponema sp.]